MKIKELKAILAALPDALDESEVVTAQEWDVYKIHNVLIETDMTNGNRVLTLCQEDEPHSTSARDFEPHPGFDEINGWLYA